jgi:hypothetical protein
MSDSENSKGKIHWKRNFSHKNIRKSSSNSHSRSMNSNSNSPKRRKSKSISNSRSRSKSSSRSVSKENKKRGPALNFMFFIEKMYLPFFQGNNEQMLRNVSTLLLFIFLNIYSLRLKPIWRMLLRFTSIQILWYPTWKVLSWL